MSSATSAARTRVARPRRRMGKHVVLFLAPFFVLFFAFTIAPILYSAYLSLFTEKTSGLGFGAAEQIFVGLDNYTRAFRDFAFLKGFGNIAIYCLFYIPIMISMALVIALMLDSAVARAKNFLRVAFYMPSIVPGLIAAIIWVYLYTPGISPLVDIFESLGAEWNMGSFLSALFSLTNINVWANTGYNVILFFAALQAVPRDVLEAAKVDGAGPIRTALQIKARIIAPAVTVATMFTVVGAMQLFAEPLLLQDRATAIDSAWTPNMFIYETAFTRHDFGYAAATALVFAAFIGALSWVVTRLGSKVGS